MPQSQQPHYNQVTSPSFIWKGLRFRILHGTPWWPEEKSWFSQQVLRWFSVPECDFSEEMGFPPWNHSFFTVFFSFVFVHSFTQLWLWPLCATPCPLFWGCPSEWNPWHTCTHRVYGGQWYNKLTKSSNLRYFKVPGRKTKHSKDRQRR